MDVSRNGGVMMQEWKELLENEMKIRIYISAEYLSELNSEIVKMFSECENTSRFFVELPALVSENEYLSDSVIACCETLLIMANPKYKIQEDTQLRCELLKLSRDERTFNILVNITYPLSDAVFHDILIFKECEVEEYLYSFELIGDQRMFAID